MRRSFHRPQRSSFTRRMGMALVVFGLFVFLNFLLFGWWIFHSLSQQEIEKVLLETREEAVSTAERIEQSASLRGRMLELLEVVATEPEAREALGQLGDSPLVQRVEILDAEGTLIYRDEQTLPDEPAPSGAPEQPWEVVDPTREGEAGLDERRRVEETIGTMGTLRILVDADALQSRVSTLRANLVRQASVIGGVTSLLLLSAFVVMWLLLRRGQRLEEQAAEAERMAYIGTLASGLAHEIRNPLNSLSLNMQMLEEDLDEAGRAGVGGRLLGITRNEIERLERLVTDFLSYARPRALEVEGVEAVELLDQVAELVCGEADALGVELRVVPAAAQEAAGDGLPEPPVVWVDRGQMRQLLLNVTQNALGAARSRVELAVEASPAGIDLLVIDDGPGIAPEERERIFEIFYSTKKGGTGLGLPIVQRIAENHGGTVTVEETPGGGTTVRVSLPRRPPEESRLAQEGTPADRLAGDPASGRPAPARRAARRSAAGP